MDRVSRERVLENLRQSLPSNTPALCRELREYIRRTPDLTLHGFLRETGLEPEDVYRGDRTLTKLRRMVGDLASEPTDVEQAMARAAYHLITVTDGERNRFYANLLRQDTVPVAEAHPERERRMLTMLIHALGLRPDRGALQSRLDSVWSEASLRHELAELLDYVELRQLFLTESLTAPTLEDVPLRVHGLYTRDDVVLALSDQDPSSIRQGVMYSPEHLCDALFVTLSKSEADYSPTTLYDDRFISPSEFHWESQSTTRAASPTGQRYMRHEQAGSTVLLFVRASKLADGRTAPYVCAGPVRYLHHRGERPMQITWELEHPVPAAIYPLLESAAG